MPCYSNCPFEIYGGDNWGDCHSPKMQGTELSHCYDGDKEEETDEEGEENEMP